MNDILICHESIKSTSWVNWIYDPTTQIQDPTKTPPKRFYHLNTPWEKKKKNPIWLPHKYSPRVPLWEKNKKKKNTIQSDYLPKKDGEKNIWSKHLIQLIQDPIPQEKKNKKNYLPNRRVMVLATCAKQCSLHYLRAATSFHCLRAATCWQNILRILNIPCIPHGFLHIPASFSHIFHPCR